jgi:hypothetical protein
MSQKPEDLSQDDNEVRRDSLNTEIIVLDGPCDHTIRPMEDWFRKILEQKGVIKPRPQAPETPTAPSDQAPP